MQLTDSYFTTLEVVIVVSIQIFVHYTTDGLIHTVKERTL